MLILLIFLSVVFVFLNFSCIQTFHNVEGKLRWSFIYTLLLISVFVVITTEVLNLFDFITKTGIIICWSLLLVLSVINWFRWGRHKPAIRISFSLSGIEKLLSYSILTIFFVTLITCLVAYPNNWDSMTYHLGRVMHWIQNKSVNPYPTQISRQVTQPPLAEYFILHLRLLSGFDRFANLVQWFFMTGSVVVVSIIMKELGKDRKMQLLAAFICATIPMGILQSNSTQNDYVVGFFIVSALLFLVRMIRNERRQQPIFLFIISAVLAITTKGTAFIFLLPLAICAVVYLLWKLRLRSVIYLPVAFIIIIAIYGPFAWRNYQTFDSPLGITYELNNDAYGLTALLSNSSKNIAMHLKTPVPVVNTAIENSVISFHKLLGVDVNAPKYHWKPSPPFQVQTFNTHEDSAGNFLHVVLFLICMFMWLLNKELRRDQWILFFFVLNIFMFLTFSFILKWQIWHCRLHLPIFIISSVFVALIAARQRAYLLYTAVILLLISSFLFLFFNQSRPWLLQSNIFNRSANEQYFANNEELEPIFTPIAAYIRQHNLTRIGLITGADTWEYPWWVLLKDTEGLRIENLIPENATQQIATSNPHFSEFIPEVIIITRFEYDESGIYNYKGREYELTMKEGNWGVWKIIT